MIKMVEILEVKILAVSNDSYYKPDEALHELQMQETIMKAMFDAIEQIAFLEGQSTEQLMLYLLNRSRRRDQ